MENAVSFTYVMDGLSKRAWKEYVMKQIVLFSGSEHTKRILVAIAEVLHDFDGHS